MFTSLRSRLWLSYALLITVALTIVAAVVLIFLIRNPLLTRQTQQQLKAVQNIITENANIYLNDQQALADLAAERNVRILLFDSKRKIIFDTIPDTGALPFPRKNLLNRSSQTAVDEAGMVWLYTTYRLADGRVLAVAAPRPKVPILNIFTDEFLSPILQGGVIALLFSLILALALSRWVADPLQEVVAAARKYPKESAVMNVAPRGPHEVQDLTRAFNSMIVRVQSSQRSQRDFVANVSHEMKTPLTSIQGFAQALLDDTADSPEARKHAAQIIYAESARMHRMVLDLLELARLDSGTADLKMAEVDLNALLRNVIDKFTPLAKKTNVELQLSIEDDLPSMLADGDRLAQVLTNLIDNALKFTPANGCVTLGAKKAGAEIEVWVEDTGVGVSDEALPHLFDRFYQVDASRSRMGGEKHGAGLGLAIVKEIVEAHGGKIGVRSELGKGTIFTVRLPRASK
jgi:signal transduction histidine kinase